MNAYLPVEIANRRKRRWDLALTLVAAPVLLIVGACCALAVRIVLGRPVLFRQYRIGLNNKPFVLLKFRTMTDQRGPDGNLLPDRQRLLPLGRFLRQMSLDELPQFFNVLRGDMSLIGPRPLPTNYLPFYREAEVRRHLVRPGITGLAQVGGRNGLRWNERLSLDARYTDTLKPEQDTKVLLQTIVHVLRHDGVATIAADTGEPLNVERSYPSRSGIAFRRFEYADIPDRVRLFNDPRIRHHMRLPEKVDADSTTQWLKKSRADPTRCDFATYQIKTGAVIGLWGLRARPDRHIPECYLMVAPECQGQGVGRLMLDLILGWLKRQPHFAGCWVSVAAANHRAVHLYQQVGFVPVAQNEHGDRIDMELRWEDCAC